MRGSKKRNRIQIKYDILKAIADGNHLQTRIMYISNLSWRPLLKLLAELEKAGLIHKGKKRYEVVTRKWYTLTQKGIDFLKHYRETKEYLESYGDRVPT